MSKKRLIALDYMILASHYAAQGKNKSALKMLKAATEEEDFDDTMTTLDENNEQGFDDAETASASDDSDELEISDETSDDVEEARLKKVLASVNKKRKSKVLASEGDESSSSSESSDLDLEDIPESDSGDDSDSLEESATSDDLELSDEDAQDSDEAELARLKKVRNNLKVLSKLKRK